MKQSIFSLTTLIVVATASFADLSRRTTICGATGYDKTTQGYYYGTEGTFSSCSLRCQRDSKNCKSFSFGSGQCNLYNIAVTGNFSPVHGSPYAFYDSSCIASGSSTTVASISAVTPSTTSTTTTSTKTSATTTKTATTQPTTTTKTTIKTTTQPTTTTTKTTTKSTTSTTAKAHTTTTTTTTAASTDPPCPLPTFEVTNFKWINSTHNADCAGAGPDVGDGTGCLDENGNWCDPNLDSTCTHCGVGVCFTGLPTQPIGYGPADSISADISSIGSCYQENPGTTPRRTIGDGQVVRCGGSQVQWVFTGDSNKANSTAYFSLQNEIQCDNGGYYYASGSGQAAMTCTYDSQKNATCVLNDPSFGVTATLWSEATYPDGSSNSQGNTPNNN